MSCVAGRSWAAADTDACYRNTDGILIECVCPLSSCTELSSGVYTCQFTSTVLWAGAILLALTWLLAWRYMQATSLHQHLTVQLKQTGAPSAFEWAYRALFPEPEKAAEKPEAAKAGEQSALLQDEGKKTTQGGTFST